MILSPEVLTIFILNFIFIFFAIIAFILSLKIFLKWDLNATTQMQYKLGKQSYLAAIIIKYIFVIKLPLFLFFIFTLDKLSLLLNGAMCAAGVVDATVYGSFLLILKIMNLYLFAYWLVLHNQDIKDETQPYTKQKFGLFSIAFFLLLGEVIVESLMFGAIDGDKLVNCCGSLYSSSASSYIATIFLINTPTLLTLFYGNFLLITLFYFLKNRYLFAISNILFIIVSLISIIAFFGTYIYQLPTHHCPFCFLEKDYNYIGYAIYILLFGGTLYGIIVGFIPSLYEERVKQFQVSLILNFLLVVTLSLYPIIYFIKNGVWL